MNKKLMIEIAKFAGAATIGAVIAAVSRPAVKKFFKLDETKDTTTIPSEDIAEEEISEEE